MIRDPRAVVYSLMNIIKEKNTAFISKKYLITWNYYNKVVNQQCKDLGSHFCKMVRYEDLVIDSVKTIKNVAEFLNLSFTDEFLHHEKYVGNKIVVSDTEWSTDQIRKKIYTESLDNWKGKLKFDAKFFSSIPMLKELKYV